jgi:sugar/nucleoside kinase (ribokinase family)
MSIVVVGSVAFDSLETPYGKRDNALGGSANFFSISASMFTPVSLCAVIGDDFPQAHVDALRARGIDVEGMVRQPGKTFHWTGRYGTDLNEAQTLDTQLNVFGSFSPQLSSSQQAASTVFLANIHPDLQRQVLDQVKAPKLVGMDSMNLWINIARDSLVQTLRRVDVLFVNDGEARMLSGEQHVAKAAKAIQAMSERPLTLVIKRGEFGAMWFSPEGEMAFLPAFPTTAVVDPTGAGDTFAGGVMAYLDNALARGETLNANTWRSALWLGTTMASFVVEAFSFDRTIALTRDEVKARAAAIGKLSALPAELNLPSGQQA